jgi:hypothetical protein
MNADTMHRRGSMNRYVLTRRMLTSRRLIVALTLVGALCLGMLAGLPNAGDGRPFDAGAWRAAKPISLTPVAAVRRPMSEDLIDNVLTSGMSRQETLDLLGEPDQPAPRPDSEVVYYLERDHSWISPDFLVLTFANDVLVRKRLATD